MAPEETTDSNTNPPPGRCKQFCERGNEVPVKTENGNCYCPLEELNTFLESNTFGLPNSYELPVQNLPPWFNPEKFKKGQKFVMENHFPVCFSEMISLFYMFAFPSGLATLIFTNKSNTTLTSCKRYLSTSNRVRSWYEGNVLDPEDEAFKNLKSVRMMHLKVAKEIQNLSEKEVEERCNLETIFEAPLKTTQLLTSLKEDFKESCPGELILPIEKKVQISQLGMSITQFSFMGLVVLYPDKFGIHRESEEDLESFVHMWRFLGYLLGTEDRFNFCRGSFEEVVQRCRDTVELIIKPQLTQVNEHWEHMSRCMIEGIASYVHGLEFEVSLAFLCWTLGIECPRLWTKLNLRHKIKFYSTIIVFSFFQKYQRLRNFLNRAVLKNTSEATRKYFMNQNV